MMKTLKLTLPLLLAFLLAAGCGQTAGKDGNNGNNGGTNNGGTNNGGTNNGGTNNGGEEFSPCSTDNPCPDGQFCFNGLCAIGCQTNDNCADDQYCDTEWSMTCQNKEVSSCPETPCKGDQICKDGLCSTPPEEDEQCMPRPDGMDGCAEDALCIEEDDQTTACYTFPPCSEDGACPVGTTGAVCNVDLIPNKGRICLTGLCDTVDNCPDAWYCVRFSANDPVGFCGNGASGAPCSSDDECNEGTCMTAGAGTPGVCF